ncbi:MAG TPA: hypothetical protein VFE47_24580 [Tepidisphaeraceae bacterium]|nr:hypothetical protein [Tepidisphaeraceae bacterium]
MRRFNLTAFLLLMLTAAGGSLLVYHENNSPEHQRIRAMEAENAELQKQVESEKAAKEKFKRFVQNLTSSTPVAEVVVRDPVYSDAAQTDVIGEYLVFTELDEQGKELSTREFRIKGKRAHIDAEVVKFDANYVEENDPEKGRSVVLFRSLYDQATPPSGAYEIDAEGQTPPMYQSSDPQIKQAQASLWKTFWKLVDDPNYRKDRGVRVAQGEGVWDDFDFGYKYRISVDAYGGPNITKVDLGAGIRNALKAHEQNTPATNVGTR